MSVDDMSKRAEQSREWRNPHTARRSRAPTRTRRANRSGALSRPFGRDPSATAHQSRNISRSRIDCLCSLNKMGIPERAKIPEIGIGRSPRRGAAAGAPEGHHSARGSKGRTRDDDVCVSRTPAPTSRRESTQTRANECARERREKVRRARGPVRSSRHPRRTPRPGRAEPQICRQRSRLEHPARREIAPGARWDPTPRLDRARGFRARDARATRPGGAVGFSRRSGHTSSAAGRRTRRFSPPSARRRRHPHVARSPNASSASPRFPSASPRSPSTPRFTRRLTDPSPPSRRAVPQAHTSA